MLVVPAAWSNANAGHSVLGTADLTAAFALHTVCYLAMAMLIVTCVIRDCSPELWPATTNQYFTERHVYVADNMREASTSVVFAQVVFVATANQLQGMPAPLLDRLEIIQLSGYTLDEKQHIAQVPSRAATSPSAMFRAMLHHMHAAHKNFPESACLPLCICQASASAVS